MSEQTDIKLPSTIERSSSREPVGLRVLGTVDPQTLTQEQFYLSPDLLYHGSKGPVTFQRKFDYEDKKYVTEFDGSATLGMGFYTTPTSKDAQDYSHVRSVTTKDTPFVTAVLPYQAKMLDLRLKDDLDYNGNFPPVLAKKWQETFESYFQTQTPQIKQSTAPIDSPLKWNAPKDYAYEFKKTYAAYLGKLIKEDDYTIRELLMTGTHPKLHNSSYPSPIWGPLFSQFMINQGYDGVICIEGSEKDLDKTAASFVFYNLDKIGDYEAWHPEDTPPTHSA